MNECPHCGGHMVRLDLMEVYIGGPASHAQWICTQCLSRNDPVESSGPQASAVAEAANVLEYKPKHRPGLTVMSTACEEIGVLKMLMFPKLPSGLYTHTYTPEKFGGLPVLTSEPTNSYLDFDFKVTDMGVDHNKPPKDVPVIEGSVIGFRAWRLNGHTWRLQGTGANHGGEDWVPGINEAHCGPRQGPPTLLDRLRRIDQGPHAAPGANCHCGLNALARFQDEAHWYGMADRNGWRHVIGAFEAWSDESEEQRFFIHPTGFRAQYGQIVLLAVEDDCPTTKRSAIKALAADYGADMCKLSHLEDAAKEHGQLVSDEILEWATGQEVGGLHDPFGVRPESFEWSAPAPKFEAGVTTSKFIEQMAFMRQAIKQSQISMGETALNLSHLLNVTSESPPRPRKGVKQHLKTPGPPWRGKWKKGDIVQDCKRRLYECVAGGSPGSWSLLTG